eukprot:scaffold47887_cov21-Cyclotella_meneghiniana.AAC.2
MSEKAVILRLPEPNKDYTGSKVVVIENVSKETRKLLTIVRGQKITEDNGKISVDESDFDSSITALLRRSRPHVVRLVN